LPDAVTLGGAYDGGAFQQVYRDTGFAAVGGRLDAAATVA